MQCRLRPLAVGVDRRRAVHDVVVDAVLRVRRPTGCPEQPRAVGFVVTEQHRGCPVAGQRQPTQPVVFGQQPATGVADHRYRVLVRQRPRPRVAEPQRRQHVQHRVGRPAVADPDDHAHVLRPGLGAFHPASLVMVLGSMFYAGNMIFTKRLSSTDSALAVTLRAG